MDFKIDDKEWQENGTDSEPSSRLLTTVHINGTPHHLEAFAVEDNEKTHEQEAVVSAFECNLSGMCDVSEPDGRWQTVSIKGRDYVLAMTPYC